MTQPDDVLFRGSDRPPRRAHPLLVVAGAVLALAFLAWQLLGDRSAPVDADPSPPPAPTSALPAPPSPATPTRSVAAAPRRDLRPVSEKTGARLVLAGRSLVDIALDSGLVRTTSVPGRIVHSLRVRGGDVLLIEAADGTRSALFSSKERAAQVRLGSAQSIVAATDGEHVWLEVPSPPGTPNILRKVLLDGRVVTTTDLGPWRAAVHETEQGMVTTSHSYFSQALELWDIGVQRVVSSYWVAANLLVVAADAQHVAFVLPHCPLPLCPMRLVDVRRGEVIDLPMPKGWDTGAAAFSTDGATLAVLGRPVGQIETTEPALLIVDLGSRESRTVSGVETLTSRSGLLTWTPDSRWLFAAAGPAGVPLLSYRLGDRRVRYEPFPREAKGLDPAELTTVSAY